MSKSLLGQFLLAKEQSNWAEGREKKGMDKDKSKDKGKDADCSNNK